MVSNESTKNLILEAKGNVWALMQDVVEVDTEWAEEMYLAASHLNDAYAALKRGLAALERAEHPAVQIDTDRALDNGYPAICPLTEDDHAD